MKNKKLLVLSLFGVLALTSCGKTPSEVPSESGSEKEPPVSSEQVPPSSEEPVVPQLAQGLKNFTASSGEERAEILYQLEKYTIDNFLGGIPMYDDASSVLYSQRLEIPSDVYIPNYGFGVSEGTILGPMTAEQEPTEAWRSYYHTWTSNDPGLINYWDGQDSVTSNLWGLITSSYYGTEFNDDKTGYRWYNSLAKELPIALNADENGMATKWRVKVKTTADTPELVYHTLSEDKVVKGSKAFNGRAVVLEDYLTPFKTMINHELFRATDLGSETSGFVGVKDYLKANPTTRDWKTVGIQLNEAEGSIDFEFNTKKTQFYAMYNLSSGLFSPIPQAFIELLDGLKLDDENLPGAQRYGKQGLGSEGLLSLGMYTLESWIPDQAIVFKKNPVYFEKDRAHFEGYKYAIIKGGQEVAYQEYKTGKLDSVGVPSKYLKEEMDNPERRNTLGNTVWKLQVNSTDKARWLELFGPNGSVYPHAKEEDYWELKPVLSNHNFLEGMYYAIDRAELAEQNGANPAQAFLSDSYMVDPEGGLGWRASEEGKRVIADRIPEKFGFSKSLAGSYFKAAMEELVAEKKYVRGTAEKPTEITLKLIYQTQTQVDTEGVTLKGYLEKTFNEAVEGFKLTIDAYATADWMDAYNGPMRGEFDLSFGSISGNPLDPIAFMDTVCSDNRSGFTLSWGPDTNVVHPTQPLEFQGELYSYDALLAAAISGAAVKDGVEVPNITFGKVEADAELAADGTVTVRASGTYYNGAPEEIQVELDFVEFWYYGADGEGFKTEEEALAFLSKDPDAWYYAGNGGAITGEIVEGENPSGVKLEITFAQDGTWSMVITGLTANLHEEYEIDYYFTVTVSGGASSFEGYKVFTGPVAK